MGYGPPRHSLEAFLGGGGHPLPRIRVGIGSRPCVAPGFAWAPAYRLTPGLPPPGMGYPTASPHRFPTTGSGPAPPPRTPRGEPRIRGGEHLRVRDGRTVTGTGISTRCPSATPHGLALGPDLPRADEPGPGTLGLPADGILTRLSLLVPAFSLAWRPRLGHPAASPATRSSPTHRRAWTASRRKPPSGCTDATASAVRLSPVTLSARNHSTSELLRTL